MKKNVHSSLAVILVVIGALLLGGFAWVRFQTLAPQQEVVQFSPTFSPSPTPSENWKTFTNPPYALQYPSEATAEARDNESIIFFMGQKQLDSGRTQTELFDGYSFRIGIIPPDLAVSFEQLATNERGLVQENCQIKGGQVSQLQSVVVAGQAGFQYSVQGCYLDYTETIVSFNGVTYRISQSYAGEVSDQKIYQEITNKIFSSLTFTN